MPIDKDHAVIMLQRVSDNAVYGDEITLISGDREHRIPIHRNILTASSKYFLAELGPHSVGRRKTEFFLDGTDGETVKATVDFCRTGRIDLTEENVAKIQKISSRYELDLLEEKCRRFYEEKLSVNSLVGTWMIADKNGYRDLRQKAFNSICKSFDLVPTVDLQKLDHRLMQELLSSDNIQATEELVFKRLLEWFENVDIVCNERMAELLELIRLQYIPLKVLSETFEEVYKKFGCSELLMAEYKRRASCQYLNVGVRRLRSILCFFAEYRGKDGAERSAINIEKYDSTLKCYDEAIRIALGESVYFGLIFHEKKLYILGGFVSDSVTQNIPVKSVSAFDVISGEGEYLPDMNSARACSTSISYGKYIYVFGGSDGSKAMNSCERFDGENKTWTEIKSMNVARCYASATVANGYIYVAGGRDTYKTCTNTVELYDPKNDEWLEIAPMTAPRAAFALVNLKGFLYALGGSQFIERYDPWKTRWTKIESFKDCGLITNAAETDGRVVAIMNRGTIGHVNFNEDGECSFDPLGESKYKSKFMRQHYLCES